MFNVMRIDRKEEGNIHTLKYNHFQFNIRYIIRTKTGKKERQLSQRNQ